MRIGKTRRRKIQKKAGTLGHGREEMMRRSRARARDSGPSSVREEERRGRVRVRVRVLGSCVAGLSLFLLEQWRGEASHAGTCGERGGS
jgi:hypothetical protein